MSITTKIIFTPILVRKTGAISEVLTDFLDSQSERIQSELDNRFPGVSPTAARKVLNNFVSLEGTKKPLSRGKIKISGLPEEVLNACLTNLENARIIRYDEGQYELSHDTLARHIDEQRSAEEVDLLKLKKLVADRRLAFSATGTYLNQKELSFIALYEGRLREEALLNKDEWDYIGKSKREAGRLRRRRMMTITAVILTLAISAGVAFWQMLSARSLARENALQSYQVLMTQADAAFERVDYDEAKILYQNAYDLARRNAEAIEDKGRSALEGDSLSTEKIGLRPMFNRLIAEGDSLKKSGGVALIDALEKYEEAYSLDYDNVAADGRSKGISLEDFQTALQALEEQGDKFADAPGFRKNAVQSFEEALKINSDKFRNPITDKRLRDKIKKYENQN